MSKDSKRKVDGAADSDAAPPIPVGREAALGVSTYWRPLKNLVSAIAEQFGIDPEAAGTMLHEGMSTGRIAHRIAHRDTMPGVQNWIVSQWGAEWAKKFGISYEKHINWRDGTLEPPDGRSWPLEVFWPDVESPARQADGTTTESQPFEVAPPKKGPRPKRFQQCKADMQEALKTGKITWDRLMGLARKELPEHFPGAGETTCWNARKSLAAQHQQTATGLQPNRDK